MARITASRSLVITATGAAALVAGVLLAQSAPTVAPRSGGGVSKQEAALKRSTGATQASVGGRNGRPNFIVERPSGPPRIATGQVDSLGRAVTISCASCHANLPSKPQVASASDLDEFHQGLTFRHGKLVCVSCHQPPNYSALHLADKSTVDFADVQKLCAQCHAKQAGEYDRGAHGGMNGYWDESRGPRRRHGCVDCHDPHAPSYPHMLRTFQALDRFLSPEGDAAHE